MHKISSVLIFAALAVLLVFQQGALASAEWRTYNSEEYGFSMLVPQSAVFVEREYGNGWGALIANYDGIMLYAIGKLGEQASAQEIERYGVKVTRVPAGKWREIDSGSGGGWNWYKTVKAEHYGKTLFGGYGTGAKGSYLIVLVTSREDFNKHRAEYENWYNSIRLR